MNTGLLRQLVALLRNLWAGTRLALMRRVSGEAFRISADQAVLLMLLAFALKLAYDFYDTDPVQTLNLNGLGATAVGYLTLLLSAYLMARAQGRAETMTGLLVLVMSAYPVMLMVAALSEALTEPLAEHLPHGMNAGWIMFALMLAWALAIVFRAVKRLYPVDRTGAALLVAVYAACNVPLALLMPERSLWYSSDAKDDDSIFRRINVENTYYAQHRLLAAAADRLAPQRPGVVDLYFLGFGSYAYQDVFLKEVRSVRALFDQRFDTQDRSMVLINNPRTVGEVPLANAHNLQHALTQLAKVMDPEEDVLFLFLTSHGTREHELSVDFWPLRPNDLPAPRLRTLLDESGIKWRVIVVSACYSGGFIEALKDPFSLIITAAARDKQSFGCGHTNEYTYFGDAYFNHELRGEHSFIRAFDKAARAIRAREQREKLTPSEPQIYIGNAIRERLERLEQRLDGLQAASAAGRGPEKIREKISRKTSMNDQGAP